VVVTPSGDDGNGYRDGGVTTATATATATAVRFGKTWSVPRPD